MYPCLRAFWYLFKYINFSSVFDFAKPTVHRLRLTHFNMEVSGSWRLCVTFMLSILPNSRYMVHFYVLARVSVLCPLHHTLHIPSPCQVCIHSSVICWGLVSFVRPLDRFHWQYWDKPVNIIWPSAIHRQQSRILLRWNYTLAEVNSNWIMQHTSNQRETKTAFMAWIVLHRINGHVIRNLKKSVGTIIADIVR